MTVAQHHCLDRSKIDAQARDVLLEGAIFRAGIEQHGMRLAAGTDREQAGQAMRGTAQAPAAQHPGSATAATETGQLGLDKGRYRGERVSDVIDEDLDVDGIDGNKGTHVVHDSAMPLGGEVRFIIDGTYPPCSHSSGPCTHLAR